jgi:hypothetical protein
MRTLRCPGLSCDMLSPLARERDGLAIAEGFCLCLDSLVRADSLQRLRAAGKLRGRRRRGRSPLTGAVLVPPPSAATPST